MKTYDEYYRELYSINLKINRIEAELSQTDLAEILGIPQSMIARYESGKVLPEMATMKKIAKALNTEVTFFFDEEFLFNIKDTELGSKYEFTKINHKYKVTYFGNSISTQIDMLSEENKVIAEEFIKALLVNENREDYFKERLEIKKEEFNEAKKAQKKSKELKKRQRINDYKRINNLYDPYDDPYVEELNEYLKEQGITKAEYFDKLDKESIEFAKKHGGRAAEFKEDENGNIVIAPKK